MGGKGYTVKVCLRVGVWRPIWYVGVGRGGVRGAQGHHIMYTLGPYPLFTCAAHTNIPCQPQPPTCSCPPTHLAEVGKAGSSRALGLYPYPETLP